MADDSMKIPSTIPRFWASLVAFACFASVQVATSQFQINRLAERAVESRAEAVIIQQSVTSLLIAVESINTQKGEYQRNAKERVDDMEMDIDTLDARIDDIIQSNRD